MSVVSRQLGTTRNPGFTPNQKQVKLKTKFNDNLTFIKRQDDYRILRYIQTTLHVLQLSMSVKLISLLRGLQCSDTSSTLLSNDLTPQGLSTPSKIHVASAANWCRRISVTGRRLPYAIHVRQICAARDRCVANQFHLLLYLVSFTYLITTDLVPCHILDKYCYQRKPK